MHLKRMELIGFKSFAEKTVFNFEDGVTAFVGPNGSGKSNVVDALRWALGEQSARRLRGEAMMDVIFAGSTAHRAAGFAEVSLLFDNHDRSLAMDFDEVVVARRLHLAGESEYMINRQLCLLRDVKELFMGTGIGGGAYNVVEQGKVDALLQAGPLERRRLFEEVAGISGYKFRRDAAVRRLERLSVHLEAIHTVVGDVNRRLRSLARQVGRARRYAELSEEVALLELDLAARKYGTFEARARELASAIETQQAEMSRFQGALAEIETADLDEAERRSRLQDILAEKRSLLTEKKVEAERADAEAVAAREASIREKESAGERTSAAEQALSKKSETQTDADATAEELKALAGDIGAAGEALSERRNELRALEQVISDGDRGVAALRNRVFEVARERSRFESNLAALRRRKAELDRKAVSLQERLASTTTHERALRDRIGDEREAAATTAALHRRFETVRARLTRRAEAHKRGAERRRRAFDRVRRHLELTEERAEVLRGLESEASARGGERPSVLDGLSGRQEFVCRLLDAVDVPAKHRTAVRAALGDALQAAVVDGEFEAALLSAVEHLRGEVLFLKEAPGCVVVPVVDFPGARPLLDVIRVPEALRGATGRLLAKVFLLPRTDWAVEFVREYPRLSAVTPGGVVIRGGGWVSLRGEVEEGGLFRHDEELERLGAVRRGLSHKVDVAGCVIAGRGRAAQRLERALDRVGAKCNTASVAVSEVTERRDSLFAESHRLCREAGFLRAELRSVETERERTAQAVGTLPSRISVLEVEEAALTHQLGEEDAGRQGQLQRLEGIQSAAAEKGEALARSEEKHRALAQRLEMLRRAVAEAEASALRLRTEAEEALRASESALKQAAQADERKAQAISHAAEIEAGLKKVSSEFEEIELTRAERAESRRRLEREASTVRDRLEELRLEQNTLLMERSSLSKRMEEKYKQDLASLASELGHEAAPPTEAEEVEFGAKKAKLEAMGPVNVAAIEEERELKQRREFLAVEVEDLEAARRHLGDAIERLDKFCRERFLDAFERVGKNFQDLFRRLFQGGDVRLRIDGEDPLTAGIEITVRPPGKEPRVLSLLSGGEKAMTAIALIMAAFKASPSPFCILDEVDGPLDEANVDRLNAIIRDFSQDTQFILVTHNKLTMTRADVIYGITMETPGVSRHIRKDVVTAESKGRAVA